MVRAVAPKPVNVLMGLSGLSLSLQELAELARAAYGAFFRAAQEIQAEGRFGFAEQTIPFAQINALFKS